MRNRVKKLEDKAEVKNENLKHFFINKDKDSYSIPTELIILLGRDPLEFEKSEYAFFSSRDNVKVNIDSKIITEIYKLEEEGEIGLLLTEFV